MNDRSPARPPSRARQAGSSDREPFLANRRYRPASICTMQGRILAALSKTISAEARGPGGVERSIIARNRRWPLALPPSLWGLDGVGGRADRGTPRNPPNLDTTRAEMGKGSATALPASPTSGGAGLRIGRRPHVPSGTADPEVRSNSIIVLAAELSRTNSEHKRISSIYQLIDGESSHRPQLPSAVANHRRRRRVSKDAPER
jgi:hypothetical protein